MTIGQESAWLYWQLTDGSASSDSDVGTLTDATQLAGSPKYNAVKHYFRYIRPGSQRVAATVSGGGNVLASAFVLDAAQALTVVLINEATAAATVSVALPATPAVASFATFTSSNGSYWQPSTVTASGGSASVPVPAYGVVTLYGTAGGGQDGGVVVTDGGSPADAGAVGKDAGSAADAGLARDGGVGADSGSPAGPDAGNPPSATGGCDCGSSGGSALPLALLLLSVWLGRRRVAAV